MYKPLILVVDDNPTHLRVCELLLQKYGLESCGMQSARAAIEAFATTDVFAAVLMDWRMPDMDGIECMHAMRTIDKERNRHTPIIAVTAAAGASYRKTLLDAGMDDYLSKPFTSEEFRALLTQHLGLEAAAAGGLLQSAVAAMKAGDRLTCDMHVIQIITLLQHIFGSNKQMTIAASRALSTIMKVNGMKDEAQVLDEHAAKLLLKQKSPEPGN